MILVDPSARYVLVGWCTARKDGHRWALQRLPWLMLRRLGLRHWRDDRRARVVERDGRVVVEWSERQARRDRRGWQAGTGRAYLSVACRRALGVPAMGARLRLVYDLARGELVLTLASDPPPFGMVSLPAPATPRRPHRRADHPSYVAWRASRGVAV